MLRTARPFKQNHHPSQLSLRKPHLLVCASLLAFSFGCTASFSQTFHPAPATDSAAQSSPVQPAPHQRPTDASLMASPAAGPSLAGGPSIPPHTRLLVRLGRAIDSGHLHNGDTVPATLTTPVRLSNGSRLPAGTPVQLSVIETLPAGALHAFGEFSLQIERVGRVGVLSDIETWRGQPGHRDVADAAPAVGTDAGLPRGAQLRFTVPPLTVSATNAPRASGASPGSINGVANGGPPPANSTSRTGVTQPRTNGTQLSNQPGSGRTRSNTQSVPAPNQQFQPVQHQGQPTSPPNQAMPTTNGTPGSSTSAH